MRKKRNQGLTNNLVSPNNLVRPLKKKLDPVRPCNNCQELKEQLEAVATLPAAYIDMREAEIRAKYQKEIDKLKKQIQDYQATTEQKKGGIHA
jgi:ElaB/YqjD/DUF883 family membrane-anchored ribosome-binding protein